MRYNTEIHAMEVMNGMWAHPWCLDLYYMPRNSGDQTCFLFCVLENVPMDFSLGDYKSFKNKNMHWVDSGQGQLPLVITMVLSLSLFVVFCMFIFIVTDSEILDLNEFFMLRPTVEPRMQGEINTEYKLSKSGRAFTSASSIACPNQMWHLLPILQIKEWSSKMMSSFPRSWILAESWPYFSDTSFLLWSWDSHQCRSVFGVPTTTQGSMRGWDGESMSRWLAGCRVRDRNVCWAMVQCQQHEIPNLSNPTKLKPSVLYYEGIIHLLMIH